MVDTLYNVFTCVQLLSMNHFMLTTHLVQQLQDTTQHMSSYRLHLHLDMSGRFQELQRKHVGGARSWPVTLAHLMVVRQ